MAGVETYRPGRIEELAGLIVEAARSGQKLELRGGGSKADVGAPREAAVIDMTGFSGIVDYDPAELVLTVQAGTPLAEVEALLERGGQMLAFDPFDHGPMFGRPAGAATMGGILAAGVSGSRRLSRGAARDHLLGFKAVSGRGEVFVGGAKVVKNVTGYDLPKIACGSWGRLMAMTEVTVKVLPRPEMTLTLAADGLDPAAAVILMSKALGSQADVAAAAHAPGLTAIRLEGFGPSVKARRFMLEALAPLRTMDDSDAAAFWSSLKNPLPEATLLLRAHVPASKAADLIATLGLTGSPMAWTMDWAGGIVWLSYAGFPDPVRACAEHWGGHAMMWRAPVDLRAASPAFNEQPAGLRALETRVRRAFDPMGVFETGRFLDGADAD